MKKIFSGLLALTLFLSMATTAFAAEINQDSEDKTGSTTLTTSKAATYTIVIPESAEITFDVEENPIGAIEYQSGNLEPDAYVTVSLSEKTDLTNDVDETYTIDYAIQSGEDAFESVIYDEDTAAGTKTELTANITKEAWEEAKAGNYFATLTFTISYTNPHEAPEEP